MVEHRRPGDGRRPPAEWEPVDIERIEDWDGVGEWEADTFGDDEPVGPRRGWLSRGRARFRRGWRHYVDTAVPADDEAPEGLPRVLQGTRGRVILGVSTLVIFGGWSVLLLAVF